MNYTKKSFSVSSPGTQKYADNWERTFRMDATTAFLKMEADLRFTDKEVAAAWYALPEEVRKALPGPRGVLKTTFVGETIEYGDCRPTGVTVKGTHVPIPGYCFGCGYPEKECSCCA